MLKIALFKDFADTAPKTLEMSWDRFCVFRNPAHVNRFGYTNKMQLPAYSPAEITHGAPRRSQNVEKIHFGVFDLDKLPNAMVDDLKGRLESLDYIFYTTWSHPKLADQDFTSAHICVRFSRPVTLDEWPKFWALFVERFGLLQDVTTKNPDRIWFGPFAPKGTDPAKCMYEVHKGKPLDVDGLLASK